MPNLLLTSSVWFSSGTLDFPSTEVWLGLFYGSCLYLVYSSIPRSPWTYWNIVTKIVLMFLSVNFIICIISGSVSGDWFFSLFCSFVFLCMPGDVLIGCQILHCWVLDNFVSYKYLWALLWDIVKLLVDSLALLRIAFRFVRQDWFSSHSRVHLSQQRGSTNEHSPHLVSDGSYSFRMVGTYTPFPACI